MAHDRVRSSQNESGWTTISAEGVSVNFVHFNSSCQQSTQLKASLLTAKDGLGTVGYVKPSLDVPRHYGQSKLFAELG